MNDIAVLRTLSPLNLRSYALLATPAIGQQAAAGRRALRLYGWGSNQNGRTTGQLQTASLDVQNAVARSSFGGRFRSPLMIAAGRFHPSDGTYAGSCSGDSGGPLVTTVNAINFLVGVTSYGTSDCDIRKPTVFTAVGAYSGWLSAAIRSLPLEAAQDNRALPQPLTATSMTGTAGLGGTLTCVPGAWTANAKTLSIGWYRDNETRIATGAQYQVVAADAGHTMVCTVFRRSDAGERYADSAPVVLPATPSRSGSVTIGGLSAYSMPAVGTVATCSVTGSVSGESTIFNWFASAGYDAVGGQWVGTGSALTLTESALRATAGKHLVCSVTRSNSMGSVTLSDSVSISPLSPPIVYVSLSPYSISDGTVATCSASGTKAGETLTYRWAITSSLPYDSLPADSTILSGIGSTYTVTATDMAALRGHFLACEATASSWQGTDTDADGNHVY